MALGVCMQSAALSRMELSLPACAFVSAMSLLDRSKPVGNWNYWTLIATPSGRQLFNKAPGIAAVQGFVGFAENKSAHSFISLLFYDRTIFKEERLMEGNVINRTGDGKKGLCWMQQNA